MAGWMAWMPIGALALACGCGSEEAASVVDCDEDVIVPLLATANDESAQLVGRADDAWVFEVKTYPIDVAESVAGGFWPNQIATRVVTVDGCGAEPRTIGDGLTDVLAPPRAGFPWLARLGGDGPTSGLYRIDPEDGSPPERIASAPSGGSRWVEGGVLAIDGALEDPSTLVLIEFLPDGRLQKTALREDVERIGSSMDPDIVYTRVAFLSTQGELLVRDIATGEERSVREDTISSHAFDAESRALLIITGDGGPMHAIESDGTRDIQLLEGEDTAGLMLGSRYVGAWSYAGGVITETQIVWMPELREFRAPGRWIPRGQAPDGAIQLLEGPDGIHRLDGDSDQPVRLHSGTGYATIFGDRIWFAEDVAPSSVRLVRMNLDGSEGKDMLGHAVAAMRQLDGDLWVYTTSIDDRGLGDLEAVDLATGERVALLDSVTATSIPSHRSNFVDDDPNDALVQRIAEDGNGIWLVHTDRL